MIELNKSRLSKNASQGVYLGEAELQQTVARLVGTSNQR